MGKRAKAILRAVSKSVSGVWATSTLTSGESSLDKGGMILVRTFATKASGFSWANLSSHCSLAKVTTNGLPLPQCGQAPAPLTL